MHANPPTVTLIVLWAPKFSPLIVIMVPALPPNGVIEFIDADGNVPETTSNVLILGADVTSYLPTITYPVVVPA